MDGYLVDNLRVFRAHLVTGFALEWMGMGITMGLWMRMGMELGVFDCTIKGMVMSSYYNVQ